MRSLPVWETKAGPGQSAPPSLCPTPGHPHSHLQKLGPKVTWPSPLPPQHSPAIRGLLGTTLQDSPREGFCTSCNHPLKCFIILTPGSRSQKLIYTLLPQPTSLALGLPGLPL